MGSASNAQLFPALPSSRPHSPGRSGRGDTLKAASDDSMWSSIFDELHSAIDDTASDVNAEASSSTASARTHPTPSGSAPRGRKRLRSSRGRSWSVGAAPTTFGSPSGDVPMRLEPDDATGERIPARTIRGFHPHLYHLRLSSSRPATAEPAHTVAPRRSSPALLASPIQLLSTPQRQPSSPFLSSSLPHDLEPMSCDRLRSPAHIDLPPGRPASAPIALSPSPAAPIAFSPSLPGSPPDSPGSWLRSPTGPRPRFRSDDSSSDAIMFTPRQLDFEHDSDVRFGTLGRRLEWNHFEVAHDSPRDAARTSSELGSGLGPAFSPAQCTRDEPISPAFALETEPGVGTS